MPASEQISEDLFRKTITQAVQDVFKTMLGLQADLIGDEQNLVSVDEQPEPPVEINSMQVVGTVGFVGDISGLIYLYLEAAFARDLAAHILGMTLAELDEAGDEVVNDAVGELTNMTVGTFKNQLSYHGYACKLTIPSILRGSNFSIEPIASATRRIYRFQVDEHVLIADLLMKQGD